VATALDTLEQLLGANWSAIRAAHAHTESVVAQLSDALADLADPNCSVVVTGSLGRAEATEGSDADWVLLVDGPSDPQHAMVARAIEKNVSKVVIKDVGPTGTFGSIVASHELVHYIAGTRDSNENLTRRILLLSESRALTTPIVRERVIRNILERYVLHDRPVRRLGVAHFLLNDVVRYSRTIRSDYASKMWERGRKGWGIRNIKLRFSRKLLFIAGMLTAFAGELWATPEMLATDDDEHYFRLLAELIREQTDVTPLELIARVILESGDLEVADAILTSYDKFLATLADPDARRQLEAARESDDPTFASLRGISSNFREGVARLFFDVHPKLPRLMRDFGVF